MNLLFRPSSCGYWISSAAAQLQGLAKAEAGVKKISATVTIPAKFVLAILISPKYVWW